MTRERWMALLLRRRIAVLPDRPVPRIRLARRRSGRRRHLLRRLDPVHRGRRPAGLGRPARAPSSDGGRAAWWAAAIQSRGYRVLQRHDLSRPAHRAVEFRIRPARVASGRARLSLLSDLRRDRVPGLRSPGLATRADGTGMVGAGGQPASAASSSGSPPSAGHVVPTDGLACSTRPRRTGPLRWARPASWPVRRSRCSPAGPRSRRVSSACAGSPAGSSVTPTSSLGAERGPPRGDQAPTADRHLSESWAGTRAARLAAGADDAPARLGDLVPDAGDVAERLGDDQPCVV